MLMGLGVENKEQQQEKKNTKCIKFDLCKFLSVKTKLYFVRARVAAAVRRRRLLLKIKLFDVVSVCIRTKVQLQERKVTFVMCEAETCRHVPELVLLGSFSLNY